MWAAIGIDDTDSRRFGCTTYVGALIVDYLLRKNARFLDYPRLIRLNPNIPWKTRGNGAVALFFDLGEEEIEDVWNYSKKILEDFSDLSDSNTQPCLVLLRDRESTEKLRNLYFSALRYLVDLDEAWRLVDELDAEVYCPKGERARGLIGALAALGSDLTQDHTYELLVYRRRENWGKRTRRIDERSIVEIDEKLDSTFDNLDREEGKVLVSPHGYDPVLVGVRGDDPLDLLRALGMIGFLEEVDRWIIYKTNQGTDAHLVKVESIEEIKQYSSVILKGVVSEKPRRIEGGHVIFKIRDGSGSEIYCAAYEPTKSFRDVISKLEVGDIVEVYGGVGKYPRTINLEKIRVIELARVTIRRPPLCECGKRTKSMGRGKGFKCPRCGRRYSKDDAEEVEIPRDLEPGFYEVPPSARRHLSKPLKRFGRKPIDRGMVPFYGEDLEIPRIEED